MKVTLNLTEQECSALWLLVDGQLDAGAGYLSDDEHSAGSKLIDACQKAEAKKRSAKAVGTNP